MSGHLLRMLIASVIYHLLPSHKCDKSCSSACHTGTGRMAVWHCLFLTLALHTAQTLTVGNTSKSMQLLQPFRVNVKYYCLQSIIFFFHINVAYVQVPYFWTYKFSWLFKECKIKRQQAFLHVKLIKLQEKWYNLIYCQIQWSGEYTSAWKFAFTEFYPTYNY